MKLIDLSHYIYTGMPSAIPSDKHVKTDVRKISSIGEDKTERHQITMSCHSGTHLDSPRHMVKEGITVDKISIDYYFGKAKKIKINKSKGESISKKDLEDVKLDDIDFLIIQTGWEEKWNSEAYYDNNPYFLEEAIKYLSETKLRGLIIDLPSLDKHDSKDYPAHKIWFKTKLILVENICNLNNIGAECDVVIAPLNLKDTEAAPARVFAML